MKINKNRNSEITSPHNSPTIRRDTWQGEPSRRPTQQGTGGTEKGGLRAAPRIAWIYVGRLNADVAEEHLKNHLTTNGITKVIECGQLPSKGLNKAFKIGIPMEEREIVFDPEFWPDGVVYRTYRFRQQ